jgi:hypothetical protein
MAHERCKKCGGSAYKICSGCYDKLKAENERLMKIQENDANGYAAVKEDFRLANIQNQELQKLCGEAADIVHLSEMPGPGKLELYTLLANAANGLQPVGVNAGAQSQEVMERMSRLYSYLSLVRHRHLFRATDDYLIRDIDQALAAGEKTLDPWWKEQMAARHASAAQKAK